MYQGGQGGGDVLGVSTSVTSTAAGIALLPNTGDNKMLAVFSIMAISLGVIVLASFVFSRVVARLTR